MVRGPPALTPSGLRRHRAWWPCCIPAFLLWRLGSRADLASLSVAWVVGTAVAWAAATALLLMRAVLPPPGEVLPDSLRVGRRRAGRRPRWCCWGWSPPPRSRAPPPRRPSLQDWWRCTSIGLQIVLPVLAVGAVVLRRLHPVGSGRIGAPWAPRAGALAGLCLHFVCGIGSGFHVSLAHGGVSVLGALLGALLLRPLLRPYRPTCSEPGYCTSPRCWRASRRRRGTRAVEDLPRPGAGVFALVQHHLAVHHHVVHAGRVLVRLLEGGVVDDLARGRTR